MATAKALYLGSENLAVTSLASLAASSTWVAGAELPKIDNSIYLALDYRLTGHLKVGASGVAAGELRIYLVGIRDDGGGTPAFPDSLAGDDSAFTWTSTYIRDGVATLAWSLSVPATNGITYPFDIPSMSAVFAGNIPRIVIPFVTHSTTAALDSSGHQFTKTGSYTQSAA